MEKLRALIQQVDDDYLVGLCNKGTVKRAWKDLEQESPVLTWQGEEAQVALKEETCTIRAPLGESGCTCPSRSICRHVVTAILWMRRELKEQSTGETKKEDAREPETGDGAGQKESVPAVLEEVLKLPPERLKRACGGSRFRQFLAHMRLGELPPLAESSFVTVTLPWENATVKLLEPFEYSTCTCHSKELCAHKAQAVLAYQMEKGKLRLEELEALQDMEALWDRELVNRTCQKIREALCRQMCTGLSRQSLEETRELERLAVLSHRANLPAIESSLRELAGEYEQYFSRSAAFREGELLRKLLRLYERLGCLERAGTQEEIRRWAGTFRETYEPAGRLHLAAMGGRTFSSKTGYEGEVYYFWETGQKRWYTWTDARPVFYEGLRRRPPSAGGSAQAPWGLNCTREQMQELEFDLINAKAASGGRLSASQETKAEITGARSLESEELWQIIAWDYEELLAAHFAGDREEDSSGAGSGTGRERLALVGAVRWGETHFDTVQQRFSWSLYDRRGRKLFVSLKYTKEERMTIHLLERLQKRLQGGSPKALIFFGSLYMDEAGRLCLYPIEFFQREGPSVAAEEKSVAAEEKGVEEKPSGEALSPDITAAFSQLCREAAGQLSDLFVSGISSALEDTLNQITALAKEAERMGLHGAAGELENIGSLLKGKRHQITFSPGPVLEAMGRLNRYLLVCRRKLSCDMALLAMRDKDS